LVHRRPEPTGNQRTLDPGRKRGNFEERDYLIFIKIKGFSEKVIKRLQVNGSEEIVSV
jgi:hypothetical protein